MVQIGILTSRARCCWILVGLFVLLGTSLFFPKQGSCRIYIDINSPSIRKFKIAIPDFKNLGDRAQSKLAVELPAVISHDLELSGYFSIMDKEAFLEEGDKPLTLEDIRFKNWSVIGADLLLKAGFNRVGDSLEVVVRLFDVYRGRQILGKRMLGYTGEQRRLMHRIGNEVIEALTGQEGIFLSRLAFVGNATGHKEIYTCDYDGHNARQVTSDKSIALLPRWSPDRSRLMYNSYKEGGVMLYMRDISTDKIRRISARSGLNLGAAWAPDGKRVALTLSRGGNPDIYIIDLKGEIIRQVTTHWAIDVSPSFSPDGKKLAFVSNRSGTPQIYVHDLTDDTEVRVTYDGGYCTSPAWSPLNRIAFVSKEGGHFDICAIDPDGGRMRRLTADQGDNEDPCWSPKGGYIAFSSNRAGRYHIYMMNRYGQNQERITRMSGDQTAPTWGP